MKVKKLSGVLVPICTPFSNGKVDIDKLERNMEEFSQTDLQGLFALGSNGENCLLAEEERKKVLSTILKKRRSNQLVMAGCSHESTQGTINLTKWVAEIGAEVASILTPHYFKKDMSDQAIIKFYEEVANSSPLPVVIYNAPGFAGGLALSVNVISTLSKHPNIIGMKDSSPTGPGIFLTAVDKEFSVMAGSADIFLSTLVMGGVGGVLSIANFHPQACCWLYELFIQGKIEKSKYFQHAIIRLNRAVSGKYGVAGVKAAMDIVGLYGGDPRLPLLPLNVEEKKNIYNALNKFGEEYPEFKINLLES
ncbi:MAG: dihydrodipicolinate synthase family protein [Candidatus Humimicrobiaceae bacterium]